MKTKTIHQFLIVAALLILATSCAVNRQVAETVNPDGARTRATSTTYVLWDASATVAKNRASAGKTSSVGSAGVNEEASATNIVAGLEAVGRLLNQMRP